MSFWKNKAKFALYFNMTGSWFRASNIKFMVYQGAFFEISDVLWSVKLCGKSILQPLAPNIAVSSNLYSARIGKGVLCQIIQFPYKTIKVMRFTTYTRFLGSLGFDFPSLLFKIMSSIVSAWLQVKRERIGLLYYILVNPNLWITGEWK